VLFLSYIGATFISNISLSFRENHALLFDGVDDYVLLHSVKDLQLTDRFFPKFFPINFTIITLLPSIMGFPVIKRNSISS
jgi:hypothetical protein